jgi:hypothetical protein
LADLRPSLFVVLTDDLKAS